jgi:hypothetical protein
VCNWVHCAGNARRVSSLREDSQDKVTMCLSILSSAWEAKEGGSRVRGQPGSHSEILYQKKKKKNPAASYCQALCRLLGTQNGSRPRRTPICGLFSHWANLYSASTLCQHCVWHERHIVGKTGSLCSHRALSPVGQADITYLETKIQVQVCSEVSTLKDRF